MSWRPDGPVHIIGVGGTGMCPLAHILLDLGITVSGSDLKESANTQALVARGLKFHLGHSADNIGKPAIVVSSSAVAFGNPEVQAALHLGIPIMRRAEFLAKILSPKKLLLVVGSHGKSSTTAMIACALRDCGLDPTYYVGGAVAGLPAPGGWGKGEWAVVEGDESDGTASSFTPRILVLLNTEWEHVDYYKSPREMEEFYIRLANSSQEHVICCADDIPADVIAEIKVPLTTYGTVQNAKVTMLLDDEDAAYPKAQICNEHRQILNLQLRVPGRHQLLNACAALTAAGLVGCDADKVIRSLESFLGVERRMQLLAHALGVKVYSDYAHHPTEVEVTLAAAIAAHTGRTIAVFQPHRYSRACVFAARYGQALSRAHEVFLTSVYSAGEERPEDFSEEHFVETVRQNCERKIIHCSSRGSLRVRLWSITRSGDQVLMMGAGDVHHLAVETAQHHVTAQQLIELLGKTGRMTRMADLAKRTTLRIGGPAEFFVEPFDVQAASKVIRYARQNNVPLTYLGRGSNLLIRDGGVRGIVLHLPREHFSEMRFIEGNRIEAGAAIRLKELVHAAANRGLGGLEFLEGIPGSLGGSLRMNAGAMGSWIFDVVESVRFLDSEGKFHDLPRQKFTPSYRCVPELQNALVVGATLRGTPSTRDQINTVLKEFSRKRWESQPSAPSAGCFFKNPQWGPAGKLIDITNLKGLSEGGAAVSTVHGNFLINQNHATAADMLRLMDRVKNAVRQAHGIELENEVIILGEEL